MHSTSIPQRGDPATSIISPLSWEMRILERYGVSVCLQRHTAATCSIMCWLAVAADSLVRVTLVIWCETP
jgi:hypothetical protein